MATWKIAGWVPDSDDEDLTLSIPDTATSNQIPQEAKEPGICEVDPEKPTDDIQSSAKGASVEESEEDELTAPAPLQRVPRKVYRPGWKIAYRAGGDGGRIVHQGEAIGQNVSRTSHEVPSLPETTPGDSNNAAELSQGPQSTSTSNVDSCGSEIDAGLTLPVCSVNSVVRGDNDLGVSESGAAVSKLSPPDDALEIHEISSPSSATSSPLTVASRSPDAPPAWLAVERLGPSDMIPKVVVPTAQIPDLQLQNLSNAHDSPTAATGRYSYRERKAIQKFPYLLEAEQYRKNMHARGVKATIVSFASSKDQHKETDEDDSQPFEPSPNCSLVGSPRIRPAEESGFSGVERRDPYDLPELDNLLNGQDFPLPQPTKRRKLVHALPGASRSISIGIQTPRNSDGSAEPQSSDIEKSRIQSTKARTTPLGFRRPPKLSTKQLLSPSPSTEIDLPQIPAPDSSPPVSSTRRQRYSRTIDYDTSNDEDNQASSDVEDTADQQAALWRRRLAGVLPASYTTLSAKALQAAKKGSATRARNASGADIAARGVARPISSHRKSPSKGTQQSPIIFSDEATPPQSPSPGTCSVPSASTDDTDTHRHEDAAVWPGIDDMEDDAIDYMSHPAVGLKRPRSNSGRTTKPHKRLRQSKLAGKVQRSARQRNSSGQRRSKRFGILDAQQKSPSSRKTDFVKVAARTARARIDQGRGSPSRKVFRLHQDTDDLEVEAVLKFWKETVSDCETDTYASKERVALTETSGNRQSRIDLVRDNDSDVERTANVPMQATNKLPLKRRIRHRRDVKNMENALHHVNAKRAVISSMKTSRKHPSAQMRRGTGVLTQHVRPGVSTGPGQLSVPILDDRPPTLANVDSNNLERSRGRVVIPVLHDQVYPSLSVPDPAEEWRYQPRRRLRRKRPPHQSELSNLRENFQDTDRDYAVLEEDVGNVDCGTALPRENPMLPGLESWNGESDPDFDPAQLPSGLLFPSSSFLGSGRFARYLNYLPGPAQERLSDDFELPTRVFWNDALRTELATRFQDIKHLCSGFSTAPTRAEEAIRLLEDTAALLAKGISFHDTVDRFSLAQYCSSLTNETLQSLPSSSSLDGLSIGLNSLSVFRIQIATRLAVMLDTLVSQCCQKEVSRESRQEIMISLVNCLRDSLSQLRNGGFPLLRTFRRRLADLSFRASEQASLVAESFVMMRLLIEKHEQNCGTIWTQFQAVGKFLLAETSQDPKKTDINSLEQQWRDLMTVLPFLQIGSVGKVERHSLSGSSNWPYVKQLMTPVLQAYQPESANTMPAFQLYCRALFCRCLNLVQRWQWQKYESMIGFLFDFFARNGLANLRQESCHHSPKFLRDLASEPELSAESKDCCFHLLLKIIATGIKDMCTWSTEKKIRGLIWRLLPNHDRHFPKAQGPRMADLDATRNHHDLICVLFWACPLASRPPLKSLMNLVQDGSHTSLYRINIQAWLNLVRFQLKRDCTRDATNDFASWLDGLIERLLRQHASIRVDIENEAHEAEIREGQVFSEITKEQIISDNQRQVETVLIELLQSLQQAVTCCPSTESSSGLLTAGLGQVLALFDPKQPRFNAVLIEVLRAVQITAMRNDQQNSNAPNPDEDSQGYDWSGFEDFDDAVPIPTEPIFDPPLYSSLHSCLSSCMAATLTPSDGFLQALVNTWSSVMTLYVKTGIKSWDNYLGDYGHDTWKILTDTEQKRRLTPFLYARLLDGENSLWKSDRQLVLRTWLVSLTDREAQLRHQGDLTSAILNTQAHEALLMDLPLFCNSDGKSNVSLATLQDRRTAIIVKVISNMREAISAKSTDTAAKIAERKAEYQSLLEELMKAMKIRYQELGSHNEHQSSYVQFVHTILKALQEHAQDLCTLDSFFTSSAAFPLPNDDPTYVASKLKAYALRLSSPAVPKQLATFLGSVVERAVFDGKVEAMLQQIYLSVREIDDRAIQDGLRNFLLRNFVPVYIDASGSHPHGWLFTLPLTQAASQILGAGRYTLDGCSQSSVRHHLSLFAAVFVPLRRILDLENMFTAPLPVAMAKIMTATFDMVSSSLSCLDYMFALGCWDYSIMVFLEELAAAQMKIQNLVKIDKLDFEHRHYHRSTAVETCATDIQKYVKRDLDNALRRTRHDREGYQVSRGGMRKTVWDAANPATLLRDLVDAARRFQRGMEKTTAFDHLV